MSAAKLLSTLLALLGFLLAALADGSVSSITWLWTPMLVVFLVAGPAASWIGLLRMDDRLVSAGLTVLSSLSLALLVATLQAVLGLWHPPSALAALATIGVVGAVVWWLHRSPDVAADQPDEVHA